MHLLFLLIVLVLVACGSDGDSCKTDRDCGEGLICRDEECQVPSKTSDTGVDFDNSIETDSGTEAVVDSPHSMTQSGGDGEDGGTDGHIESGASGSGGENGGTGGAPTSGCETDYDCKGDRICEDGDCVYPSSTNTDAGMDAGNANGEAGATDTDGSADDSAVVTTLEPVIPEITGDCPNFLTGEFSFQGLNGRMDVGEKGDSAGAIVFYWRGEPETAVKALGELNMQRITSRDPRKSHTPYKSGDSSKRREF